MSEELLKQILNEMKEMQGEVKGEMEEMKGEMKEIKSEQQRQGDLLHQLIENVGSTNTKVENLHKEATERFDHIDRQLRLFDSDFEHLNHKQSQHEREIKRLKQAIQ